MLNHRFKFSFTLVLSLLIYFGFGDNIVWAQSTCGGEIVCGEIVDLTEDLNSLDNFNTTIKFKVNYPLGADLNQGTGGVIRIARALNDSWRYRESHSCNVSDIDTASVVSGQEITVKCDFSMYQGERVEIQIRYCAYGGFCADGINIADTSFIPQRGAPGNERLYLGYHGAICNANGKNIYKFQVYDNRTGVFLNKFSLYLLRDGVEIERLTGISSSNSCIDTDTGEKQGNINGEDVRGGYECDFSHIDLYSGATYKISLKNLVSSGYESREEISSVNLSAQSKIADIISATVSSTKMINYRYRINSGASTSYIFDIFDGSESTVPFVRCGGISSSSCSPGQSGSCNGSRLMPGNYRLVMRELASGSIYDTPVYTVVDEELLTIPEPTEEEKERMGVCKCAPNSPSSCQISGDSTCYVSDTPPSIVSCNPVSSICTCSCGTPRDNYDYTPPSEVPGAVRVPEYNLETFKGFIGWIHNLLIAVGVVAAVFIFPYSLVLMASGNPENINKGKEWLYSLLVGLGVLILSGTIIRLFGNVLSLN